jgi:group I intron endonuclease
MFGFDFFRRAPQDRVLQENSRELDAGAVQEPVVPLPPYGYVYSVVCRTNNKGYIGQTTQKPEERWHQHRQDARAKKQTNGLAKRFHFALHEHGENTFEFKVIDTALSHEELNEKERYWIARYKYDDPAYGYNSTSGGSAQKEQVRLPNEVDKQATLKETLEKKRSLERTAAEQHIEWENAVSKDWEKAGTAPKVTVPVPTDIEDVGNMLVQDLPPEDYGSSPLLWRKTSRGNYSLSLYVFRGDGSFITSNGHVSIFGHGRVNNNVHYYEKYHVTASIHDQTFEGFYPTFALAIKAADRLVEIKAPENYKRLRRDYEPPADETQKGYLKTLYGDRDFPTDLTHKQAQQLIKEHRWMAPSTDKQRQKNEDNAVIARVLTR